MLPNHNELILIARSYAQRRKY